MTDGLHRLDHPDRLAALPDGPIAPLGLREWALTRPDVHLAWVRDGALVGRASLWWTDPPPVPGRPDAVAGRIGHAAWASGDVGEELVRAGLDDLSANGCTIALGPLDGSTWFAYRVVTDEAPGGVRQPPFWLEPTLPAVVAESLGAVDFEPMEHYLSSLVEALPDEAARLATDLRQLREDGTDVRPFDAERGEEELEALYPLLLRSFADNPFYTPLDRGRFLASYRALLPHVDPDLILVAERDRQPVGVALGLPDLAQAARGEAVDTVIVKTLAVDPDERGAGLGGTLVRAVQEAARGQGLTRAIHALMHAENTSVRISRHLGVPIRRYALLARPL